MIHLSSLWLEILEKYFYLLFTSLHLPVHGFKDYVTKTKCCDEVKSCWSTWGQVQKFLRRGRFVEKCFSNVCQSSLTVCNCSQSEAFLTNSPNGSRANEASEAGGRNKLVFIAVLLLYFWKPYFLDFKVMSICIFIDSTAEVTGAKVVRGKFVPSERAANDRRSIHDFHGRPRDGPPPPSPSSSWGSPSGVAFMTTDGPVTDLLPFIIVDLLPLPFIIVMWVHWWSLLMLLIDLGLAGSIQHQDCG